jgi:hypothetical protein
MADELRDRVLAAVRKGLAGPLETSKPKKPVLQGYSADFATENGVTAHAIRNTAFPNKMKDVTQVHQFSTNRDGHPERVCALCGAADDLWHLDTSSRPIAIHRECFEFLPRPEAAEPTAAYQAASPDCTVTVVSLPATGLRYRRTFAHLQLRPPDYVPEDRWRQAIMDSRAFLHRWGSQAELLNWSSADLFGLIEVPEHPSPSFNRLSRLDRLGLVWALQGREVIALIAESATIKTATGATLIFYRHGRPALGPLGDALEDLR